MAFLSAISGSDPQNSEDIRQGASRIRDLATATKTTVQVEHNLDDGFHKFVTDNQEDIDLLTKTDGRFWVNATKLAPEVRLDSDMTYTTSPTHTATFDGTTTVTASSVDAKWDTELKPGHEIKLDSDGTYFEIKSIEAADSLTLVDDASPVPSGTGNYTARLLTSGDKSIGTMKWLIEHYENGQHKVPIRTDGVVPPNAQNQSRWISTVGGTHSYNFLDVAGAHQVITTLQPASAGVAGSLKGYNFTARAYFIEAAGLVAGQMSDFTQDAEGEDLFAQGRVLPASGGPSTNVNGVSLIELADAVGFVDYTGDGTTGLKTVTDASVGFTPTGVLVIGEEGDGGGLMFTDDFTDASNRFQRFNGFLLQNSCTFVANGMTFVCDNAVNLPNALSSKHTFVFFKAHIGAQTKVALGFETDAAIGFLPQMIFATRGDGVSEVVIREHANTEATGTIKITPTGVTVPSDHAWIAIRGGPIMEHF